MLQSGSVLQQVLWLSVFVPDDVLTFGSSRVCKRYAVIRTVIFSSHFCLDFDFYFCLLFFHFCFFFHFSSIFQRFLFTCVSFHFSLFFFLLVSLSIFFSKNVLDIRAGQR